MLIPRSNFPSPRNLIKIDLGWQNLGQAAISNLILVDPPSEQGPPPLGPEVPTYILSRGSRHIDPGLGEEGAWAEHEGDVQDGVDGVLQDVSEGLRGREVVAETADGVGTAAATVGPDSQ